MVPKHLGIIPDGNRRWAKAQGLATLKGHQAGVDAMRETTRAAFKMGIETITYFAFSTENWKRTEDEVGYLMKLFANLIVSELKELEENGGRFVMIGERARLNAKLRETIEAAEERTRDNTNGTFVLCLNYGSEQEIASAAAQLIRDGVAADEVTPELIAAHLYAPQLPPVDFVIRTSGEHRLSGFMLLQAAYAELYFTDTLWPDFGANELKAAVDDYSSRARRFGV